MLLQNFLGTLPQACVCDAGPTPLSRLAPLLPRFPWGVLPRHLCTPLPARRPPKLQEDVQYHLGDMRQPPNCQGRTFPALCSGCTRLFSSCKSSRRPQAQPGRGFTVLEVWQGWTRGIGQGHRSSCPIPGTAFSPGFIPGATKDN